MSEISELRKRFEASILTHDEALQRLPFPKRLELSGLMEYQRLCLGKLFEPVEKILSDPRRLRLEASNLLLDILAANHNEDIHRVFPTDNIQENIGAYLMSHRFQILGGRVFQVQDDLNVLLKHTDLGTDIPCDLFRAPFTSTFFEFGVSRKPDPDLLLHDLSTGDHILEGAYVTSLDWVAGQFSPVNAFHQALGVKNGEKARFIEFAFIGSPLGKNHLLDDTLWFFNLFIREEDEQRPILNVMNEQLNAYEKLNGGKYRQRNEKQLMLHLCKVMLFLNTSACLKEETTEYSDLKKHYDRVGDKKKDKIKRRLTRSYDRIIVRAKVEKPVDDTGAFTTGSDSIGRAVASHIRRGHFRNQPHGRKRLERKLIWICPVIINPDSLISPPVKPYILKT